MKAILYILGYFLMGVLATILFVAVIWFCLAIPDILKWISGYIGELCTWVLFLTIVGCIIAWCVDKGRN